MSLLFKELHFCLLRIWAKKGTEGISLLRGDEEPSLSFSSPPLLRFGPVPISPRSRRRMLSVTTARSAALGGWNFFVCPPPYQITRLSKSTTSSLSLPKGFRNLPHRHNFNLSSITRVGVSPVSHSLYPNRTRTLTWGNHKADAEYVEAQVGLFWVLQLRIPIPIHCSHISLISGSDSGRFLRQGPSEGGRAERGRRTKRASVIIILGGGGRLFADRICKWSEKTSSLSPSLYQ